MGLAKQCSLDALQLMVTERRQSSILSNSQCSTAAEEVSAVQGSSSEDALYQAACLDLASLNAAKMQRLIYSASTALAQITEGMAVSVASEYCHMVD